MRSINPAIECCKPAHSGPSQLPPEVIHRAQELQAKRLQKEPGAEAELVQLIEQHPALAATGGDLGQQAVAAWLNLIAGTDRVFWTALGQKVADLRRRFAASPDDPAGQMIVDRVIATWLQVAYADARMAQAGQLARPELEFLARRQQQAQRQHLAALQAWRQWRRLAADLPGLGAPTPTAAEPAVSREIDDPEPWIIPLPRRAASA